MRRPVGDRQIEAIRVARLHRDVKADPMRLARKARNHLPANRFEDAEHFEDAQLLRDRRAGAPGRFGDRVIGRETGAVAMAIEALQKGVGAWICRKLGNFSDLRKTPIFKI